MEVNGVDVEAAKELKQWIRKDNGVECFLTTKKGGTAWELVTRRVTINSDTGDVIQDLNVNHSIIAYETDSFSPFALLLSSMVVLSINQH